MVARSRKVINQILKRSCSRADDFDRINGCDGIATCVAIPHRIAIKIGTRTNTAEVVRACRITVPTTSIRPYGIVGPPSRHSIRGSNALNFKNSVREIDKSRPLPVAARSGFTNYSVLVSVTQNHRRGSREACRPVAILRD